MKHKVRRILVTLAITCMVFVVFTGCRPKSNNELEETKETGTYQKLSADEAKERMDSGDDIVILDVRTEEEYEESYIPGAILIPNETIGTEPLTEIPKLDQEILVYCRSGNRSAKAAKKLIEAGYTNVYDFGGIIDWPYETETKKEK